MQGQKAIAEAAAKTIRQPVLAAAVLLSQPAARRASVYQTTGSDCWMALVFWSASRDVRSGAMYLRQHSQGFLSRIPNKIAARCNSDDGDGFSFSQGVHPKSTRPACS